jgi:hypothetical protein
MNRNKKGSAAPKAAGAKSAQNSKNMPKGKSGSQPRRQIAAAAAYSTGLSSGEARIYRDSVDSCRIKHRELIGSLTGSVNFAVQSSFSLNPGLASTAPWLALESQGWEKYHFNSLKLCYYTRTATSVPGSVILAVDYDAADAAPVSEQIASAYFGTQEDAPWKDICLNFDPRELAGVRYIRPGALAPNLDVKTYDVGTAFVCTTDGTAVNWGKVWLEYDVTLYNPQLPPGGSSQSSQFQNFVVTSLTGANLLTVGNYGVTNPSGGITLVFTGLTAGQEYCVSATLIGTVLTACSAAAGSGFTSVTAADNLINAAAMQAGLVHTFKATLQTAQIVFTFTGTTLTSSNGMIAAVPSVPLF